MRKPECCLCENKGADQLCSNCTAVQHLCFRCADSTVPLLLKSEGSSFQSSSVAANDGLCRTVPETPKADFMSRSVSLNSHIIQNIALLFKFYSV